jgi:biopolymer transport protein ExbD
MASMQKDDEDIISGINVTPLVDITLVLLIIFMVTASYIVNSSIKVDLPKAKHGDEMTASQMSIVLDKEGKIYLNGESSSQDGIKAWLEEHGGNREKIPAIISADRRAFHGNVVALIDFIKGQGITQFVINTKSDIEIDSEVPTELINAMEPMPNQAQQPAANPAPQTVPNPK